jgi:hypothetical protein
MEIDIRKYETIKMEDFADIYNLVLTLEEQPDRTWSAEFRDLVRLNDQKIIGRGKTKNSALKGLAEELSHVKMKRLGSCITIRFQNMIPAKAEE